MGRRRTHQIETEIAPVIRLWMLRILVPLRGDRNFLNSHGFSEDGIAEAIDCPRALNFDPPCALNFDPGVIAARH